MGDIDLSVCMVTWNARDLTLACLKSLIEQTRAIRYEIVLVDNGSADGTLEAVQAGFPQVRTISNTTNEGFTRANNQALRVANGRYAILLNQDMLFESDALSRMVAFMDKHIDIGVLECRLRFPDRTVQHTAHEDMRWQDFLYAALFLHRFFPRSRIFGRLNRTYLDYEANDLAVDTGWVAGAALMVRTASMEKVGLLDERIFSFSEDWEWCRRFASKGYRIVYYTGAEIIHYHGMSSTRHAGPNRDQVRETSILRTTASGRYVFHKLHTGASIEIFLFDLAYRLFCLSRAVAYWLHNLLHPQSADHGTFRGYLASVFMSYESLSRQYLRAETQYQAGRS